MRIALDATYSLGDALSGVGVYSRELLNGLAASGFAEEWDWDWFYRSQRYLRARMQARPSNVRVRLLSERKGERTASLFHGLNQRLPALRFRRQVATFHDLFVLSGEYSSAEFRERFAAQARAAAGADLIIAVSAFTASQVEHYLKVPRERIRVIHHGVVSRPAAEVPREKIILCVGAIQKRKNQIALVQAFRATPPDWTLVLAGSQGYEAEATVREVANSPASRRILLTGYISDTEMARWYARASIFAFPSLDEGFGMPVLEAMAAGVPVIAGNTSSLPEICGDAARLVNPRDVGELANAIEILARDDGLRAEMAAAGKQHAQRFRWDDAVQKTAAVYKELL